MIYRKQGMSANEAVNRAMRKLMKKKVIHSNSGQYNGLGENGTAYDPESYAKMKKISLEESTKTMQLKKELDNLINPWHLL